MSLALSALAIFLAVAPTSPLEADDYELVPVASGLSSPLYVTAPHGDARLFVVEQGGRIRVIENGAVRSTPFLNVSSLITSPRGGEQGLLGMAFHPNYPSNGRFFIAYTNSGGDVVVAEYHATPSSDVADSAVVKRLMTIDHPFSNHNGGMIIFGPDGYLYIGSGDGGGGGDPNGNGQNRNSLLGKILRIDVDGDDFPGDSTRNYTIPPDNPFVGASGADEVWIYGVRNPWRFWIDGPTDRFYVADVGQGEREEVTVLASGGGGANLGWNRLEGTRCYPSGGSCSTAGTVLPQVEYTHAVGRSITGGIVYRGSGMPELVGTYFYADFASGWVRSFRFDGQVRDHYSWSNVLATSLVSSFGTDGQGELYVVSLGGSVWRIEGRSSERLVGDFTGEGRSDLLMRRGRHLLAAASSSNGATAFQVWTSLSTASGWTTRATGDFNNDGRDDIANYHPGTGNWVVSRSTGSGFSNSVWSTFSTKTGWSRQLVGDFNGDNRDDIANYHPGTGNWVVSRSTGSGFSNSVWSTFSTKTGWSRQLVGDFTGDGRDDIANYHPGTGNWVVSRSTGSGFSNSVWSTFSTKTGWSPQRVGDFNNDGRDDIANYHAGTGNWVVSRSTGSGFSNSVWSTFSTKTGWSRQLVGDFNGDGRDDIANYHPGTGNWVVSRSTGSGFSNSIWSTFSTKAGWTSHFIGDFNADGRDDVANYHPSNGNWVVSRSTGTGFSNSVWSEQP